MKVFAYLNRATGLTVLMALLFAAGCGKSSAKGTVTDNFEVGRPDAQAAKGKPAEE